MQIQTIATGSTGNAYMVQMGGCNILLDCGITLKTLQEWCWSHDMRVSDIDLCLITHEHQDHAKLARTLLSLDIRLYASAGTVEACRLDDIEGCNSLEIIKGDLKPWKFEDITIRAFDVKHDAKEPLGFIISAFNENLLYVTDTAYIKYRFNNLTHMIVECNHVINRLAENVRNGVINEFLAKRVATNHMSLETLKKWLERCDRSKLQEVYMCHLSESNAEADRMKQGIKAVTGVPVYVC